MKTWRGKLQLVKGNNNPTKVWEVITWASLAVIFLWAVAKALGLIKTPLIIELLPLFAAVFAAGGFSKYVKLMFKVLRLEIGATRSEVKEFKVEMHEFKREINEELKGIKSELRTHDNRLVRIEAKLA